jgi:ubiquinone/menaquinone biosynthesis C-methylase UbiE
MAAPLSALRNYWTDAKCARAFWGQHELPPYRQLLAHTIEWAAPRPGERWLDLGCGGGALTRGLWDATGGRLASVVGVDCAANNADAYNLLRETLTPDRGERIEFVCHDFSDGGLAPFADEAFDHVVSGLSISYAQSYDEVSGAWTQDGYDRVLADVLRVLRPGGRFVFSVNVPEPSWARVGLLSLGGVFGARRPIRYLQKAWRMMRYGAWLKREARTGRFHYLPGEEVAQKLKSAGYSSAQWRLSYAGQAYVFRAVKSERR